MRMDRGDRTAIEDLDRLIRVAHDLRRLYPVAIRMTDDVSIKLPRADPGPRHVDTVSTVR